MTNIFSVQDQITKSIVESMRVVFTEDESARSARAYTPNLEAYDLFLRGRSYLRGSRTTHAKARQLFGDAIALDPNFAAAYAERSLTYFSGFIMPMSRDPEVVHKALADAERAVKLDPSLPLAHARLGWALFANRRHEEAIAAAKRSVALGPNSAEAHIQYPVWQHPELVGPAETWNPADRNRNAAQSPPSVLLLVLSRSFLLSSQ